MWCQWLYFALLLSSLQLSVGKALSINAIPTLDLRPVPSDDLDDIKAPSFQADSLPLAQTIDHPALRKKLGKYYDPQYMSIGKPRLPHYLANNTNLSQYVVKVTGLDEKTVLPQFKDFKLTGYDGKIYKIGRDSRKKVKRWLSSTTFCRVQYKWIDLSSAIWPRYILQGSCINDRSCSIPPGMTCRGTEYKYKRLLTYTCLIKRSHDKNGKTIVHKRCTWRKFKFPILTRCECKC
ncbi:uncharacterized protein TRIADDRAFT_21255 [Trichoplax adhaerens]|uniref:Noggin n=1 Tax=Trichoplax adhaerens TaxID=10228 RepID=B3RMU3_TRIAD|nr:hypothetical protein TRIADDRAFT_21255 [Trichoplax adhaerens]EDV27334.1 hypothetical protein TRIADDRAFT_21255 [Trichoplax adhaerens]|eukprot:XP_002109168.1 hypothetical protein TRIADDRAFT_21255 [Trichoplax adhaerens]